MFYREEIDGLRAVAVVSVILYHAGFKTLFPGGYVGVDIFFVISGYLIASIIKEEHEENRFSLVAFYERRCRRILPALFFILFISSIFAYFYMLPDQLKEFGESLISVIGFSSNLYFWYKDDGYFSRLTDLNPLVHTWSLAVEEQFYFIFPLICYLFIKKRDYFYGTLICLGLSSLFLCEWGGNLQIKSFSEFHMFFQAEYASFYLPIGRMWELLIGVFIAFYMEIEETTKTFSIKPNQFLSFFGFLLITISIIFFEDRYIPPFPNLYTLMPTCGTALIILYGQKTTLIGHILSHNLLKWIGLMSYSAYLWHQPLFAFIRLQSYITLQYSTIFILLIIVCLLSTASYFFVEQPFRNKKNFSQEKIFSLAGIGAVLILIIGLCLIITANHRISLLTNVNYTDDMNDTSDMNNTYLVDLQKYYNFEYTQRAYDIHAAKENNCSTTRSPFHRRLVLIGDSFSQDFYNMMIETKHLMNYEVCFYKVEQVCQIYLGNEDREQFIDVADRQRCRTGNDIKYALPMIRLANVIILTAYWRDWSSERLSTTIELLNLTKHQKIFVIGRKDFGVVNPKLYIDVPHEVRINQYQYPDPVALKSNEILKKTLDQSVFVDIESMICTGINYTCPIFTPNGKLITYDGIHLSKYGARYIGNLMFNNEPLNKLK